MKVKLGCYLFFIGQSQHNQNALLQGQALQGQAVFIQGQPNGGGQAIMLQNQGGHQGQVQIITTTSSSGQQLQIVPQIQQKGGMFFSVYLYEIDMCHSHVLQRKCIFRCLISLW